MATYSFPETKVFLQQWGRVSAKLTAYDQALVQQVLGTDFSGGDFIVPRTPKTDHLFQAANLSAVASELMRTRLPKTEFGDRRLSTFIRLMQKLHPALQRAEVGSVAQKEASVHMLAGLAVVASLHGREDCVAEIQGYSDAIFIRPEHKGLMTHLLFSREQTPETRKTLDQAKERTQQGRKSASVQAAFAEGQESVGRDTRPEERRHHSPTYARHEGGTAIPRGTFDAPVVEETFHDSSMLPRGPHVANAAVGAARKSLPPTRDVQNIETRVICARGGVRVHVVHDSHDCT